MSVSEKGEDTQSHRDAQIATVIIEDCCPEEKCRASGIIDVVIAIDSVGTDRADGTGDGLVTDRADGTEDGLVTDRADGAGDGSVTSRTNGAEDSLMTARTDDTGAGLVTACAEGTGDCFVTYHDDSTGDRLATDHADGTIDDLVTLRKKKTLFSDTVETITDDDYRYMEYIEANKCGTSRRKIEIGSEKMISNDVSIVMLHARYIYIIV